MPAIANTLIVDNTFTIDNNTIDVSQADLTFSIDAGYIVDVSGTGALRIPSGTTDERPVGVGGGNKFVGCIRYNTSEDSSGVEIYDKNQQWIPLGSGGGGGSDGGGSIGSFVFDGSMIFIPNDSMNIKAPDDNIYITTGTDKIIFFDSSAVKLPSGPTTARPTIDVSSEYVGTIRYNSETSQYEGFGNEYEWKTIGGGNTSTEQGVTTTTFENDLAIEGKLTATEEISAPLISTTSDSRYKQNINTITNALSKINEMRGVYYELMTEPNIRRIGVIAQETEKIFPEVISTDKNDYKSVSYGNLVGALIESIKELSVKNTQLEKTVNNLKGRIENLEQKL